MLLDLTDDRAVTAAFLARHDPLAGCVVVHPTPGAAGRASLATTCSPRSAAPSTRRPQPDRPGGRGMAGRGRLGGCRPHRVPGGAARTPAARRGLDALLEFAATVGAAVLLVCHTRAVVAHLRARLPAGTTVTTDLAAVVRELDAVRARRGQERPPRRQYADLPRQLPFW